MFFSRALLLQYEKVQRQMIGPLFRKFGQSLYRYGAKVQNEFFHEDKCNNHC
jgi:hypothetical protein